MRIPRSAAALALLGVAPGLVTLAAPVQAATLASPTVTSGVSFTASPVAGVTCALTSGSSDFDSADFAADGVARTVSSSATATFASADGTDVTTMSGASTTTVKATQVGGQVDTVTLTRSYSASLSANLGAAQQCRAKVSSFGSAQYQLVLPSAAYVTVTLETRGGGGQGVISSSTATPGAPNGVQVEAAGIGPHAVSKGTGVLPAGTTTFALQAADLQLPAPTPASAPAATASGSATVVVRLQVPGAATDAKAQGKAKKYVVLPAGRDCGAGTLSADWTKKVGKKKASSAVSKAVFYVNGAKAGAERRPTKKTTTKLKGLDPTAAIDVRAVLKLAGKGRGTVEVSRSYLPCQ